LSMLKIHCKRHYRNLATYSCCTTWREHFTKTAPARRRHSVGSGGGGAPISYDRRRRRQQNVGGGGAAAHSSTPKAVEFLTICCGVKVITLESFVLYTQLPVGTTVLVVSESA